jgi:formylglycine-generating enzyme required for sulfatase activity
MSFDERDEVGLPPGYEPVRRLGQGGMGVVYLARQLSLGRLVALKMLPPLPRSEASARAERFRREAELMAKVAHANVLSIHDFGIEGGRPYLVMEYVEGGDLGRRAVPGRPMDPARVRSLVAAIARALSCLHRGGILHRDLKPSNILMRDDLTPKVADFGVATLAGGTDPSRPDVAPGTPDYMAPEQRYGLKVDERCDQYSLAAVAYELLTGRKPLGAFAPPSRHNPDLTRGVDEAILRALSEDRDDRYATAEEFADALDRALAVSRPQPRVARPVWAAVVGVAALGGIAAMLLLRPGGDGPAPAARFAPARSDAPPETKNPEPAPVVATPSRPAEAPPRSFTNTLGMMMLPMMPGDFLMGSPETDPDALPDEKPQHLVKITRPFYLAACEVTNRQFRTFVERTGYRTEAERSGLGGQFYDPKTKELAHDPQRNFRSPISGRVAGEDEPVVQVTWSDAKAFCDWLSKEENRPYRLPTEAEWEYACRAGTTTRWCTGDDPAMVDAFAWTIENAGKYLHSVGTKRANSWGLHDMHGNAWEWCEDWFGPYAPESQNDPAGPPAGQKKTLRGGSWDWTHIGRTRSASRIGELPDGAHFTHGFRVALGPAVGADRPKGTP